MPYAATSAKRWVIVRGDTDPTIFSALRFPISTHMKFSAFAFILTLLFFQNASAQSYTAERLYQERRSNSQAFEDKYFNKTFTVTGKIWTITPCSVAMEGFKNYHKVGLTGTGYEMFIIIQLPFDQKALLDGLRTGQTLTVTGTYNDREMGYVLLNNCSFGPSREVPRTPPAAPARMPLGKYSVYQNGGAGFAYQYALTVNSYNSYTLNGKTGRSAYDARTHAVRFLSGPLKGFRGLYRPFHPKNDQEPPTIVIDPRGGIPDLERPWTGYQYAYYKGR
ncbi:MAG: hypothetical protein EOO11_09735 [Chitinophagaceae bacterium]|nr:MAG: hypothetical protein EOO11_09735 [Chitinophagaceae bacterium]